METIDEIYQNIGQSIADAIEEDKWTKAQLNIEVVGKGVAGYSGEYYIGSEKNDLSVRKLSREIRNWIRELHEITTEGNNNRWNRATFTINPDGKFHIDFI